MPHPAGPGYYASIPAVTRPDGQMTSKVSGEPLSNGRGSLKTSSGISSRRAGTESQTSQTAAGAELLDVNKCKGQRLRSGFERSLVITTKTNRNERHFGCLAAVIGL